ncbi:MAG TPA: hypothetical protein VMD02_00255 [Candidatus Omnitrophota bacterium]|nr:hypothetical protein [Candidatus Omnitrophota bacterium]
MGNILVQKPIALPSLRLIHQRVIWSFKDGQHNPVLNEMFRNSAFTATLSANGVTLSSDHTGHNWRVPFDTEGFILRANGLRYTSGDVPVNALARKGRGEKTYVSFWDLVYSRDRAPVEGRSETWHMSFGKSMEDYIEGGDERVFGTYLRARVGKHGDIFLQDRYGLTFWGLALERHYAGKPVLLVPLRYGEGISFGIYDPDPSDPFHIYTCYLDLEEKRIFAHKARNGAILKEYYAKLPADRSFHFFRVPYYFNHKAIIGDVYVIERSGTGTRVRQCDQNRFATLHPIIRDGKPNGYLVGDMWPTDPLPLTGKVSKGIPVHWDAREGNFAFKLFGRFYTLVREDAVRLNVGQNDPVYVTMEEGQVTEVRSKSSERVVYFRTVRDENYRLLYSNRAKLPERFTTSGVRILEGVETSRLRDSYGVILARKFIAMGKFEGEFRTRPASVAIVAENGSYRLLHGALAPRFGPGDRDRIDAALFERSDIKELSDLRNRFRKRREELAQLLAHELNGYNTPLRTRLDRLRDLVARSDISALDLILALDMIYELAMDGTESRSRMLEIFTHIHLPLLEANGDGAQKVRRAFLGMFNIKKLARPLYLMFRNSLADDGPVDFIAMLAKDPELKRKIGEISRAGASEEPVGDHPFGDEDGV